MKNLLKFFFELGQLKREPRSGWALLGVESPESVAEHSLRAAQIAFFLALKEKADVHRVCTMVIFHDIGEIRTGDRHKLAQRYVEVNEEQAVLDQCAPLEDLGAPLYQLWSEREARKTLDAKVAHDADLVDVAVQAKEYMDQGYLGALEWIEYAQANVQTETAKKVLAELLEVKMTDWWKGLKKL